MHEGHSGAYFLHGFADVEENGDGAQSAHDAADAADAADAECIRNDLFDAVFRGYFKELVLSGHSDYDGRGKVS